MNVRTGEFLGEPSGGIMSQHKYRLAALSIAIVVLHQPKVPAQTKPTKNPLQTVADVPLPGLAVRFDYQSLDSTSGRLYIAHMNADHLVVFDTQKREVLANISGFAGVHGVWAVPELQRVYASATGDHEVVGLTLRLFGLLPRSDRSNTQMA